MNKKIPVALHSLAHGLLDGGCEYTTNFPGTYSQTLFELLGGSQISTNEKVAYEMAFGASLAGKRAVTTLKNVGLSVAADPYLNSLLSGVHAGLVVVLIDDVEVWSSQARMDARHYLDFYGGLWLEPISVEQVYSFGQNALEWSEELDIPVVIRITNQLLSKKGTYSREKKKYTKKKPVHNPEKYIIHPTYWKSQFVKLQEKNAAVNTFISSLYAPEESSEIAVFGNCEREVAAAGLDSKQTQAIYSYPFPEDRSKSITSVFEQGDSFALEKIAASKGMKNLDVHSSNTGDLFLDIQYRVWEGLEKMFAGLKAIDPTYVVADLTQFTRENTNTIDTCLCLGASVSTAIGLAESGVEYPFVVAGDASLLHSSGLIEAVYRKTNMGIVVIENGGSWCTGGQRQLVDNIDFCKRMNIPHDVVMYEKTTQKEFTKKLSEMQTKKKLSVLFVKTE